METAPVWTFTSARSDCRSKTSRTSHPASRKNNPGSFIEKATAEPLGCQEGKPGGFGAVFVRAGARTARPLRTTIIPASGLFPGPGRTCREKQSGLFLAKLWQFTQPPPKESLVKTGDSS